MFESERLERQDQLTNLILDLSKLEKGILNESVTVEVITELKDIYKDHFRHQYSALYPTIREITISDEYDPDILLENVRIIREYVEIEHSKTGKYNSLYLPLLKLMDHINLELARHQVATTDGRNFDNLHREIESSREELTAARTELMKANTELFDANLKLETLTNSLNTTREELDEANERTENLQSQLVAVLSIFAAIIVAFFGGISFLGSAITSIQNVTIFKSILICVLCGLLLFNLVFLLLYVVAKLINRSIFAQCIEDCNKKATCDCNSNCASPCTGIKRVRKRLPYVFWVNVGGITVSVVDVVAWYLHIRSLWPFNFY